MNSSTKSALGLAIAIAVTALSIWGISALFELHQGEALHIGDVLALGQLVALTLGLGSVVLLWLQSRDESKWRRLLYYHQFFTEWPSETCRGTMLKVLTELGLDAHLSGTGMPLEEKGVAAILSKPDYRQGVVRYLDGFEQLSGAVNAGIVDDSYTYKLDGTRLLRIYTIFSPLILTIQGTSPLAYVQFQHLAVQWKARREKEQSEFRASQSRSIAPK